MGYANYKQCWTIKISDTPEKVVTTFDNVME